MLRWAQTHTARAAWRLVSTSPALSAGGQAEHWTALLTCLAWQAVATAAPHAAGGDLNDPRQTIKVKTLRGGDDGPPAETWMQADALGLSEPLEAVLGVGARRRSQRAFSGPCRGAAEGSEDDDTGGEEEGKGASRAREDDASAGPWDGRLASPLPSPRGARWGGAPEMDAALPSASLPYSTLGVRPGRCEVLRGVVFRKGLPLKGMAADLRGPRVLLMDDALTFGGGVKATSRQDDAEGAPSGGHGGGADGARGHGGAGHAGSSSSSAAPSSAGGAARAGSGGGAAPLDAAAGPSSAAPGSSAAAAAAGPAGPAHGRGLVAFGMTQVRAVLQQEEAFSAMLVRKVVALQPSLVLCSQGIARPALEELARQGVVAVPFVKRSVLARVSRATGAAVVPSVNHLDKLPRASVIGRARRFRVAHVSLVRPGTGFPDSSAGQGVGLGRVAGVHPGESASPATRAVAERTRALRASSVTVMRLDAEPGQQACTVMLRGDPAGLKSAKAALRSLVAVAYTAICQASCLLDMGMASDGVAAAVLDEHFGRRASPAGAHARMVSTAAASYGSPALVPSPGQSPAQTPTAAPGVNHEPSVATLPAPAVAGGRQAPVRSAGGFGPRGPASAGGALAAGNVAVPRTVLPPGSPGLASPPFLPRSPPLVASAAPLSALGAAPPSAAVVDDGTSRSAALAAALGPTPLRTASGIAIFTRGTSSAAARSSAPRLTAASAARVEACVVAFLPYVLLTPRAEAAAVMELVAAGRDPQGAVDALRAAMSRRTADILRFARHTLPVTAQRLHAELGLGGEGAEHGPPAEEAAARVAEAATTACIGSVVLSAGASRPPMTVVPLAHFLLAESSSPDTHGWRRTALLAATCLQLIVHERLRLAAGSLAPAMLAPAVPRAFTAAVGHAGGSANIRLSGSDVEDALDAAGAGQGAAERDATASAAASTMAAAVRGGAPPTVFEELSLPELPPDVPGAALSEPLEVLALAETVTVNKSPWHRDNGSKDVPTLATSPVWRIARANAPGDVTLGDFVRRVATSRLLDVPTVTEADDADEANSFPGPPALYGVTGTGTSTSRAVDPHAATMAWWMGTCRVEVRVQRLKRGFRLQDHSPPATPLPVAPRMHAAMADRRARQVSGERAPPASPGGAGAAPHSVPAPPHHAPPSPALSSASSGRSGSSGRRRRARLPLHLVSDSSILCFGISADGQRTPSVVLSRAADQLSLVRFLEMLISNRKAACFQPASGSGAAMPPAVQVRRVFAYESEAVEFRVVPVPILEVATRRVLPYAAAWAKEEREGRVAALLESAERVHSGQMQRLARCCVVLGVDAARELSAAPRPEPEATAAAAAAEGGAGVGAAGGPDPAAAPAAPVSPPPGRPSSPGRRTMSTDSDHGVPALTGHGLPGEQFTTPEQIRGTAVGLAMEAAAASRSAKLFATRSASAITDAVAGFETSAALGRSSWFGPDGGHCDALSAATVAWRWTTRARAAEESVARLELLLDKVFGDGVTPVVGAVTQAPAGARAADAPGRAASSGQSAGARSGAAPPPSPSPSQAGSRRPSASAGRHSPDVPLSAGLVAAASAPHPGGAADRPGDECSPDAPSPSAASQSMADVTSTQRAAAAVARTSRASSRALPAAWIAQMAKGGADPTDTAEAGPEDAAAGLESTEAEGKAAEAPGGDGTAVASAAPAAAAPAVREGSDAPDAGQAPAGRAVSSAGGGRPPLIPGRRSSLTETLGSAGTPVLAPAGDAVLGSSSSNTSAAGSAAPPGGMVLVPGVELPVGGQTPDFGLAPGVDGSVAPLDPSLNASVIAHCLLSGPYWESLVEGMSMIRQRMEHDQGGGRDDADADATGDGSSRPSAEEDASAVRGADGRKGDAAPAAAAEDGASRGRGPAGRSKPAARPGGLEPPSPARGGSPSAAGDGGGTAEGGAGAAEASGAGLGSAPRVRRRRSESPGDARGLRLRIGRDGSGSTGADSPLPGASTPVTDGTGTPTTRRPSGRAAALGPLVEAGGDAVDAAASAAAGLPAPPDDADADADAAGRKWSRPAGALAKMIGRSSAGKDDADAAAVLPAAQSPQVLASDSRQAAKRASTQGAETAAVRSNRESSEHRGSAKQADATTPSKRGSRSRYELRRTSTRATLANIRGRMRQFSAVGGAAAAAGDARTSPRLVGSAGVAGALRLGLGEGLPRMASSQGSVMPPLARDESLMSIAESYDGRELVAPASSGRGSESISGIVSTPSSPTVGAGVREPTAPSTAGSGSREPPALIQEDLAATFDPAHPRWTRGCFGKTLALTPEETLLSQWGQDVVSSCEGRGRDGSVRMKVTSHWATHFHALRQLCLGSQRSFVESLAMADSWQTTGEPCTRARCRCPPVPPPRPQPHAPPPPLAVPPPSLPPQAASPRRRSSAPATTASWSRPSRAASSAASRTPSSATSTTCARSSAATSSRRAAPRGTAPPRGCSAAAAPPSSSVSSAPLRWRSSTAARSRAARRPAPAARPSSGTPTTFS